ncbi:MAG: GLPGLI family protein, partial [Bacteroidota bacterium]
IDMKNFFWFLIIAWLPATGWAQSLSGKVVYQEAINMHKQLGSENEDILKMVPEFQYATKVLSFTEKMAVYRVGQGDDEAGEYKHEEGGMQIRMVFNQPDDAIFQNTETGEYLEQKTFMGKQFLIEGEAEAYKWKLTGEQEKLGAYVCQKAILQDTSRKVVAWFTPQIPAPHGPGTFGKLPGLILKIDIDEGTRVLTATDIQLNPENMSTIEAPTKGKKVTRAQYEEIVEEKTKALQEQMGGGSGGVRVIRRN